MTASTENKNALNVPDSTRNQVFQRVNELVIIEENTTVVERETYGNSFILGSSNNGVLGTNILGSSNRVRSILKVVNVNNVFREHFKDTSFQDGTAVNTADWDTTKGRLAMSSSNNHMTVYNTTSHSGSIVLNDSTITNVKINSDETKYGSDTIQYFISADGGVNWKEVTNLNTTTPVHTPGVDLKYKIIFVGNGGSDTYIENLNINYNP